MALNLSLSASTRSSILSLGDLKQEINQASKRLNTGKKVNDALDNASAFFRSKSLNDRASDLKGIKDGVGQAISTVKSAVKGLETLDSTLKQMKGLAEQALGSDTATRATLATQFDSLRGRIVEIIEQSSYAGVQMLDATPDDLTVAFNESATNSLTINGIAHDVTLINGGAALAAAVGNWADLADVSTAITEINGSITRVRSSSITLSSSLTFLENRIKLHEGLISTLEEGSDKLILADENEEGARFAAASSRRDIALQVLSLGVNSERAILNLIRG